MAIHHITLTIDTDPDGIITQSPDRKNLVWDGLHFAMEHFHRDLPEIPLTWYLRADGQLKTAYGSDRYLLDTYADFWREALKHGDELGWHPHLYTIPEDDSQPTIITESTIAIEELKRIWGNIKDCPLPMPSFRMGEAWHTSETLNLIESLGFAVDSTAIPNRDDSALGHPRNWKGAPNQPYYPCYADIRQAGAMRPLLEVPMTTWYFQAPYDKFPKLRYMNPCIHSTLWDAASANLLENINKSINNQLWVLILHPAEAMPNAQSDQLYAHSMAVLSANISNFAAKIRSLGHEVSYGTLFELSKKWRTET